MGTTSGSITRQRLFRAVVAVSLIFIGTLGPVDAFVPRKKSSLPVNRSNNPRQQIIIVKDANSYYSVLPHPSLSARAGATTHGSWPLNRDPKGLSPDFPLTAARITITAAVAIATWYAQRQYSNVLASAALTLVCSVCFDRRLGQAAFCGSFAGMSGAAVIPDIECATAMALLTSVMFELLIHTKNYFLGIGGRLGATAFLATTMVAAFRGVPTGLAKLSAVRLGDVFEGANSAVPAMALWHAIGSVATIVIREASDDSAAADPVRASAVVGLLGALFLQDKTAALALYGGSFVGMSLPSRLMDGVIPGREKQVKPHTMLSLLVSFATAGALGGIVHGLTVDLGLWPGGWGGKAGICAFVGCLIYRGIMKSMDLF